MKFILLINVGILTFMRSLNFMLTWVEHEKSFIILVPDEKSISVRLLNQNNFLLLYKYVFMPYEAVLFYQKECF